ncbi:MAG: hypothetical protein ACI398_10845, partial [Clostridium sp.]
MNKNSKKSLALAAAALSVFELGAVCGNALETTKVSAAEKQVTMAKASKVSEDSTASAKDVRSTTSSAVSGTTSSAVTYDKVSIIKNGTEIGKNLTATLKDSNGTTSAAVSVVLNEDISVDNIVSNFDEEKKAQAIRSDLEQRKTINANLNINGLVINTNIEIPQDNNINTCGWLVDQGYLLDDNIISVTLRTKELTFNKDGVEYIIPNFEYKTYVNVASQNQGNTSAVELKSAEINGTMKVGETLSAQVTDKNDNIVNSGVAYRWYRYDRIDSTYGIEVGKEATYELQKEDEGKYIKLVVANDNNSVEVMSQQIAGLSSGGTTIKTEADGSVHLVDASGNAATGWQKIDEEWYFGEADGKAATGWKKVDGTWYLMNNGGV